MVQVRLVQNCKTCFFQVTYKNLTTWYTELRQYRPAIPTLLAANKIDENMEVRRQWHFFIDLQDFHHRWQPRASLLPARTISLSTMCLQQTGLMLLRYSGPGNSCKNALFKGSSKILLQSTNFALCNQMFVKTQGRHRCRSEVQGQPDWHRWPNPRRAGQLSFWTQD